VCIFIIQHYSYGQRVKTRQAPYKESEGPLTSPMTARESHSTGPGGASAASAARAVRHATAAAQSGAVGLPSTRAAGGAGARARPASMAPAGAPRRWRGSEKDRTAGGGGDAEPQLRGRRRSGAGWRERPRAERAGVKSGTAERSGVATQSTSAICRRSSAASDAGTAWATGRATATGICLRNTARDCDCRPDRHAPTVTPPPRGTYTSHGPIAPQWWRGQAHTHVPLW